MRALLATLCAAALMSTLMSADYPTGASRPLHEAFVTRVVSQPILEAIGEAPPAPVAERSPPQPIPGLQWVGGYWDWSMESGDWVWVSGVWRKAPPGRLWIAGFWRELEQGWVRFPGFWSETPHTQLEFLSKAPPDPVEEPVLPPPSNHYFWLPGHWAPMEGDYAWLRGAWEPLDPQWVLTPAHYVWRPGGYLFVESYWDWPLEERGFLYANEQRPGPMFEPAVMVLPDAILQALFVEYPSYLNLYQHHFYYNPDFWDRWCCTPPWWSWTSWWSLTTQNQWALWWWWTHPGYGQPVWLTADFTSEIVSPEREMLQRMEGVMPPPTVTPRGVVSARALLEAIGPGGPILPLNSRAVLKVAEKRVRRPSGVLRPTGQGGLEQPFPRPMVTPGTLGEPPHGIRTASTPRKPQTAVRRRPATRRLLPGQRPPANRVRADRRPAAARGEVRPRGGLRSSTLPFHPDSPPRVTPEPPPHRGGEFPERDETQSETQERRFRTPPRH